MLNFKAEKGEWLVNVDLSKPLSFGEGEDSLLKDIENNKKIKQSLKATKTLLRKCLKKLSRALKNKPKKPLNDNEKTLKKAQT